MAGGSGIPPHVILGITSEEFVDMLRKANDQPLRPEDMEKSNDSGSTHDEARDE